MVINKWKPVSNVVLFRPIWQSKQFSHAKHWQFRHTPTAGLTISWHQRLHTQSCSHMMLPFHSHASADPQWHLMIIHCHMEFPTKCIQSVQTNGCVIPAHVKMHSAFGLFHFKIYCWPKQLIISKSKPPRHFRSYLNGYHSQTCLGHPPIPTYKSLRTFNPT